MNAADRVIPDYRPAEPAAALSGERLLVIAVVTACAAGAAYLVALRAVTPPSPAPSVSAAVRDGANLDSGLDSPLLCGMGFAAPAARPATPTQPEPPAGR